MFSRPSLRKSSALIPRILANNNCNNNNNNNQRLIIARALSSSWRGFGYGDEGNERFLRIVSSRTGVVVAVAAAGSLSLGFGYWFSTNSNVNSILSFVDSSKDTWVEDEDQFQHSINPEKSRRFLFGGSYLVQLSDILIKFGVCVCVCSYKQPCTLINPTFSSCA